ncbi:Os04g0200000, partial [Oryza sativa Japonica Group]
EVCFVSLLLQYHLQPPGRAEPAVPCTVAVDFPSKSGLLSRVISKLVEGKYSSYPPLSLSPKIRFYPFEFDANLDSFSSLSLHQTLGFPGAIPCVPSPISLFHGYK